MALAPPSPHDLPEQPARTRLAMRYLMPRMDAVLVALEDDLFEHAFAQDGDAGDFGVLFETMRSLRAHCGTIDARFRRALDPQLQAIDAVIAPEEHDAETLPARYLQARRNALEPLDFSDEMRAHLDARFRHYLLRDLPTLRADLDAAEASVEAPPIPEPAPARRIALDSTQRLQALETLEALEALEFAERLEADLSPAVRRRLDALLPLRKVAEAADDPSPVDPAPDELLAGFHVGLPEAPLEDDETPWLFTARMVSRLLGGAADAAQDPVGPGSPRRP